MFSREGKEDNKMTIGERIRRRRIELGMSQDELAKRLGYKDRSTISYIEKNGGNLQMSKVEEIAKILEMPPEVLMGWGESEDEVVLTSREQKMLALFRTLNADGQEVALTMITVLSKSPEYIKNNSDKAVEGIA